MVRSNAFIQKQNLLKVRKRLRIIWKAPMSAIKIMRLSISEANFIFINGMFHNE